MVQTHRILVLTSFDCQGGHVRVGMGDNVYSKKGELLQSNATAVERIVRLAKDMNRDIATPAQAREILGLSSTPSSY